MIDLESFAAMETELLAALDGGKTPLAWNMTAAMHDHLDEPRAVEMYQVPVSRYDGADHSWRLYAA